MKAVIASAASRGSNVRLGCWPIAISTIIVSPTAREIASTNEAMMPETAAGTTMRVATCTLVDAERVGPLAQIARHRAHRVLGERGDGRHQHHAHHERGGERVEDVDLDPDVAQERRHEREREVAEDDRRDAGEDLERGLQDAPRRAARRTRSGRSRSRGPTASRPGWRSPSRGGCRRPAEGRRSGRARRAATSPCRSGSR